MLIHCAPADPLEAIRALHQSRQFEESIEPLRDLIDSSPSAEAHYLYGLALIATDRGSVSMFPLQEAMEDPEWTVRAGMLLAQGAIQAGNGATGEKTLGRVLEMEPDNTEALMLRANTRVQVLRNFTGGLEDAERALEIDPDLAQALIPKAVALLGLERVDEAGATLEALEEQYTDDELAVDGSPWLCAVRAMFTAEKGETDKARERFDGCVETYPASRRVIKGAVDFYDAHENFARSIEILRSANEKSPDDEEIRIALAMRLAYPEALEVLEAGTDHEDPQIAAGAWTDLGGYYAHWEKFDESIASFERALELFESPTPALLFAMADALVRGRQFDRALQIADEMTVVPHRELVRGRVYFEQRQFGLALEHLSEGLKLWPDNAVARHLAAVASEHLGEFDRAIEEYRYVMRIDAGATDARVRLARLHLAEGASNLALTALRHSLSQHPPSAEATLLELELIATRGKEPLEVPTQVLERVQTPELRAAGVAALAAGARKRGGAKLAAEVVQATQGVDLTLPINAAALAPLVEDLITLGDRAAIDALLDAALASHPRFGEFHALQGTVHAHAGLESEARASFEHALRLAKNNFRATFGVARLDAASNVDAAVAGYRRAARLDPRDTDALRSAADLLIQNDRAREAEADLIALLDRDPFDTEAALKLAVLYETRNADPAITIAMAKRAVRFGNDAEARALLERLTGEESAVAD
jgi:tetratricopeptide (TPR) repeat protein